MSRDDVYDLVMGMAVVTVGYLLWKQQQKATAAPTATGPAVTVPDPIAVQGNDQTGYWIDTSTLFDGVL